MMTVLLNRLMLDLALYKEHKILEIVTVIRPTSLSVSGVLG